LFLISASFNKYTVLPLSKKGKKLLRPTVNFHALILIVFGSKMQDGFKNHARVTFDVPRFLVTLFTFKQQQRK